MERINSYDFYDLSLKLHPLATISAQAGVVAATVAFLPIWEAQRALHQLLAGNPIELVISKGKAEELRTQIDAIVEKYFTQFTPEGIRQWRFPNDSTPAIPEWEWSWVNKLLANFEMIFAEEMRAAATYRVPARGIYNIGKLVDSAETAFASDIAAYVPDKTKVEWRSAGRCMAFGMFTACGFHVARAVEGTLEAYHRLYVGPKDQSSMTWGLTSLN